MGSEHAAALGDYHLTTLFDRSHDPGFLALGGSLVRRRAMESSLQHQLEHQLQQHQLKQQHRHQHHISGPAPQYGDRLSAGGQRSPRAGGQLLGAEREDAAMQPEVARLRTIAAHNTLLQRKLLLVQRRYLSALALLGAWQLRFQVPSIPHTHTRPNHHHHHLYKAVANQITYVLRALTADPPHEPTHPPRHRQARRRSRLTA